MRLVTLAALASSLMLAACNPDGTPGNLPHPGEDTAGVGMRMRLEPQRAQAGSVRAAAAVVAQQETAPGTYLCVCPPPITGDAAQTRSCTCQVEGAPELPAVCGDHILNVEAGENCDLPEESGPYAGRKWCPDGYHCNMGGEKADDGVVYPACFNCVKDVQPDAGT